MIFTIEIAFINGRDCALVRFGSGPSVEANIPESAVRELAAAMNQAHHFSCMDAPMVPGIDLPIPVEAPPASAGNRIDIA